MIASRDPEDRAWRALFAQAGAHSREARDYVTRAGETIAWGGTITYEVTVPTSAPRTLALHALSQIATRIEVRLEELVRWQQTALALGVQVLATEWQQRFADATTLWRMDGTRCRAVLSDDFTPIDTVPLMRSLEAEWRAMTLAPTRLDLAGDVQRLEFAARHGAGGNGHYRPGIVLLNSEVGSSAVTLAPALVRRNGAATMLALEEPLRIRHTVASAEKALASLRAAAPQALAAADQAIRRWDAMRLELVTPTRFEALTLPLEREYGVQRTETVIRSFATLASKDQTWTGFYRTLAAVLRAERPNAPYEADPLLTLLLRLGPANDTLTPAR